MAVCQMPPVDRFKWGPYISIDLLSLMTVYIASNMNVMNVISEIIELPKSLA